MPARRARKTSQASYIVVGASTGGYSALRRILKDVPEDFPGAILIVIHVAEKAGSALAAGLARVGRIPVEIAVDGAKIRQGRAYVAPSGSHFQVHGGRVVLGTGERVQHFRPSIDVLFRSAANEFGPRVIGVILSGMLKDGTIGLRAVRDAGGITIVQNPERAEAGDMPRNAMTNLGVDYCLELSEIGPVLELLVHRAGQLKQGVLETGLASSLRLMKLRAKLLEKLVEQSLKNPRTSHFLKDEVTALDRDIDRLSRLILS